MRHFRLLLPLCAGLLAACSPSTPPPPEAAAAAPVAAPTEVAPPQPLTETWELPDAPVTRADMEARFGAANLRQEMRPGPEGDVGQYPVLVLFPDDARKRLELVVDAEHPDAAFPVVSASGPESLWHDASGLRPGMSLEELVALNGAPVSFHGLGWDYGGTVADWHGGKLASAEGATRVRSVILAAREGADSNKLPMGDGSFRSDDARWGNAGKDMVVREVGIRWSNAAR